MEKSKLGSSFFSLSVLGIGLYNLVLNGWDYEINLRLVFGHGYVLYDFTALLFGGYGLFLVYRYGWRGLPLSVIFALTCDVAMTFLNVWPGSPVWEVFTWNYGLQPALYAITIYLCWRLARPLELNLRNQWLIGMLISWLLLAQVPYWFGVSTLPYLEPLTELGWILASFNSLKPLASSSASPPTMRPST